MVVDDHRVRACPATTATSGRIPPHGFRWNFDLHVQFPMSSDPDYMEKTVRVEFRRPLTIERIEPQWLGDRHQRRSQFCGGRGLACLCRPRVLFDPGLPRGRLDGRHAQPDDHVHRRHRRPAARAAARPPTATSRRSTPPTRSAARACRRAATLTLKLSRWVPFRTFTQIYTGRRASP